MFNNTTKALHAWSKIWFEYFLEIIEALEQN